MTYRQWNEPQMVCDPDGSNEHLDEKSSFANIWGKADPKCACGREATVIWTHSQENNEKELVESLCDRHAMAMALGLMRDVAENIFGTELANLEYQASVKQLNQRFPK